MHGSQLGFKAWARLLAMIYDVDPLGGSPCPAGSRPIREGPFPALGHHPRHSRAVNRLIAVRLPGGTEGYKSTIFITVKPIIPAAGTACAALRNIAIGEG